MVQLVQVINAENLFNNINTSHVISLQEEQLIRNTTDKNLFRLVKICDGLVKFKDEYRETRV